jgi:hypothetical protein
MRSLAQCNNDPPKFNRFHFLSAPLSNYIIGGRFFLLFSFFSLFAVCSFLLWSFVTRRLCYAAVCFFHVRTFSTTNWDFLRFTDLPHACTRTRQFNWGFHVSRFFEFRAKSQDANAILISAFPHFEHKSAAAFFKCSIFGLYNSTCHDFLNFAPTPS